MDVRDRIEGQVLLTSKESTSLAHVEVNVALVAMWETQANAAYLDVEGIDVEVEAAGNLGCTLAAAREVVVFARVERIFKQKEASKLISGRCIS